MLHNKKRHIIKSLVSGARKIANAAGGDKLVDYASSKIAKRMAGKNAKYVDDRTSGKDALKSAGKVGLTVASIAAGGGLAKGGIKAATKSRFLKNAAATAGQKVRMAGYKAGHQIREKGYDAGGYLIRKSKTPGMKRLGRVVQDVTKKVGDKVWRSGNQLTGRKVIKDGRY